MSSSQPSIDMKPFTVKKFLNHYIEKGRIDNNNNNKYEELVVLVQWKDDTIEIDEYNEMLHDPDSWLNRFKDDIVSIVEGCTNKKGEKVVRIKWKNEWISITEVFYGQKIKDYCRKHKLERFVKW